MHSKYPPYVKEKVKQLRLQGMTYAEIGNAFNIPKATLSCWFKNVELPTIAKESLHIKMIANLHRARARIIESRKVFRKAYLDSFLEKNKHYRLLVDDPSIAKVALAMLYAGEGAKSFSMASIRFGNSDPLLVKLFLKLFKICYDVDLFKLRCGVQCRADQDIEQLEQFWYTVTDIPLTQFIKAKVDPRTLGKPTLKSDYKGVCLIQYSSSVVFYDLMKTIEVITGP